MYFDNIGTYFAVFSCYIGIFATIFIVGFPSPTQKELLQEHLLDEHTLPVFASISHITRIVGVIVTTILVEFGIHLRTVTIINSIVGVIGYALIIVASSTTYIITGVVLVGFYTGSNILFVNTYTAEVALDHQRQLLSGGIGFSVRIGLFIVYFAGIWLNFRWLAVLGLFITCLFCFMVIVNPASPVWYIQHGMDERAKSTLHYLHGRDFDTDTEIEKIKGRTLSRNISWIEGMRALKHWNVLKPIIFMIGIAFLKEFGGHEGMVSFSSHILENQQAMNPKVASLFYPICLIVGAIVYISIQKHCKLKLILITASIFQAISHISMAIYYLVSEHYLHCNTDYTELCHNLAFWPILNIAIYAFAFGFGWGLVYFALIGIVFTVHREIFTAICSVITNITNFIVVMLLYYLLTNIGGFATFLIFSVNYFIAIVYVSVFMKI